MPIKFSTETVNPVRPTYPMGESGQKVRTTYFHWTFNTNQRIEGETSEALALGDTLIETLQEFWNRPEEIAEYVNFDPKHKGILGAWNENWIFEFKTLFRLEIGENRQHGRRLHAHVLVTVKHRTDFWFDIYKVRDEINRRLEEKDYPLRVMNVHVQVRGGNLEDYLKKD